MGSQTKSTNEDGVAEYEQERWYSHITGISIAVIFIVVGVPVWWQTTTVYRADLPYSDIQGIRMQRPVIRFMPEVVLGLSGVDPILYSEVGEVLEQSFGELNMKKNYVLVRFDGNLRSASKPEQELISSIRSVEDLERFGKMAGDSNHYQIYILPVEVLNGISVKLPFINSHRQVFITSTPKRLIDEAIPSTVAVCQELVGVEELAKTFRVSHGAQLNDKDLLTSLKFDSSYTLVFSLLVPQPGDVKPHWDMQAAAHEYLSELQNTVGKLVDLKVKSQVLYHETLASKPINDKSGQYNYLEAASLPHLINPIEARLGSFVDTNQALNFLVYIPSNEEYPLHIHNSHGQRVDGDGFLVPRWGGFMVYNMNSTSSDGSAAEDVVDMSQVFSVFLPQIKALLGFTTFNGLALQHSADLAGGVADWELDSWMRKKTVENIATSAHALYSLSSLVQRIRNMVINDQIANQVYQSVNAVTKSHQHLARGHVASAYHSSKISLQSAEKAFFDPSLLELLYFPEDQKFAIYIPLFLPIGLPILGSLIVGIKWFATNRKEPKKPKAE